MKRTSFVCGQNVDRSLTAEDQFKNMEYIEVKPVGVSHGATIPVTRETYSGCARH